MSTFLSQPKMHAVYCKNKGIGLAAPILLESTVLYRLVGISSAVYCIEIKVTEKDLKGKQEHRKIYCQARCSLYVKYVNL